MPMTQFFICCGIIVHFVMPIWWVSIFPLPNLFFLFSLSSSFPILCNTIIFLIDVKWCSIILWLTVRLVHDWNSWTPFKNKAYLGHTWLLFHCSKLKYPIYYLLDHLYICPYVCVDIFQWLVTWNNFFPISLLDSVQFLLLFSDWFCWWCLCRPLYITQMLFLTCCSMYWGTLVWLLLVWGHLISHFLMGNFEASYHVLYQLYCN